MPKPLHFFAGFEESNCRRAPQTSPLNLRGPPCCTDFWKENTRYTASIYTLPSVPLFPSLGRRLWRSKKAVARISEQVISPQLLPLCCPKVPSCYPQYKKLKFPLFGNMPAPHVQFFRLQKRWVSFPPDKPGIHLPSDRLPLFPMWAFPFSSSSAAKAPKTNYIF